MSGQPLRPTASSASPWDDKRIVANVRRLSGVTDGPDDAHILAAVRGFVEQFESWYVKVMREAVARYRHLIIGRINPFIRRIECEGFTPEQTADKLVEDYNARNFVTAGGWALEVLAIRVSPYGRKSTAEGIDVERVDPATGEHHLYVLKSGLVTRNSDIMGALKRNARQAEKLLRQGGQTTRVHAHYAIVAGKTESSFEDGINRPSSAELWAHMTGLPEQVAVDLVLAIAAEAGQLVRRDVSEHLAALKLLVADYIASRDDPNKVDWEFIAKRNMSTPTTWAQEDKSRHAHALEELGAAGYTLVKKQARKPATPPVMTAKKKTAPKEPRKP